jgi:hypothetical protein
MNKYLANLFICSSLLALDYTAFASPAIDAEFAKFKAEGANNFSADQGKLNWNNVVISKEGEKRACVTCHGTDPNKSGLHATTQKIIEPMSLSVNPERFADIKKMEKWFKRNCEWAWSRECTAQEKGDILKYLMGPNQESK